MSTNYTKPSDDELHKKLTPLQYEVTQHEGTEPPFRNEYWDNHKDGIYVDRISGEPLFSSRDKFESGTGWPSFTKPLEPSNVVTKSMPPVQAQTAPPKNSTSPPVFALPLPGSRAGYAKQCE